MNRVHTVVASIVLVAASMTPAFGYTVVVPPTTFSSGALIMQQAVAMLDDDSVFLAYTEGASVTKFLVANINTGAIELSPTFLANGLRQAMVKVVGPDAVLIVTRDDTTINNGIGRYFVVNPLTGAILRGPITFTEFGTGWEHRVAVTTGTSALITHRSNNGWRGVFTVIDPLTGNVKVPETSFDPYVNSMDVAALDERRVLVAYDRPTDATAPPSFVVLDAASGATWSGPHPFPVLAGGFNLQRLTYNSALIAFQVSDGSAQFATLDTGTAALTSPTTFTTSLESPIVSGLLGDDLVLFVYSHNGAATLTVRDRRGPLVVPETTYFPENIVRDFTVVTHGCRAFLAYNTSTGTYFEVLDFNDVCSTTPCPVSLTDRVDILRSRFAPFLSPALQVQLVLFHNRSSSPIPGPLALVADGLQNAVLFTNTTTICPAPWPAPSPCFALDKTTC